MYQSNSFPKPKSCCVSIDTQFCTYHILIATARMGARNINISNRPKLGQPPACRGPLSCGEYYNTARRKQNPARRTLQANRSTNQNENIKGYNTAWMDGAKKESHCRLPANRNKRMLSSNSNMSRARCRDRATIAA